MTKYLKTIFFFGIPPIVLIFVLEIVMRFLFPFEARVAWSQSDAVLGYRYTPQTRYWYHQENDHPIQGQINRFGFRDIERSLQKPAGVYRVAVLGDSFVEAFQVEQDQTFLALAEKKLGTAHGFEAELLNFGHSGFSPAEEYLLLQRDVLAFSPDMVVLFFHPDTDIADLHPQTSSRSLRPFFYRDEKGKLFLDTRFSKTFDFKIQTLARFLNRRWALSSFLTKRVKAFQTAKIFEKQAMAEQESPNISPRLDGANSLATAHPDPLYSLNYELGKTLIRKMADLCRARGIRFMLVGMDNQAYAPEVAMEYRQIDPSFDPYFFEKDLNDFSKNLGIDFLGLQKPFRDAFVQDKDPLHWDHWTYRGHRLTADLLAKKLILLLADRFKEPAMIEQDEQ